MSAENHEARISELEKNVADLMRAIMLRDQAVASLLQIRSCDRSLLTSVFRLIAFIPSIPEPINLELQKFAARLESGDEQAEADVAKIISMLPPTPPDVT